jgi:hypothetical protein
MRPFESARKRATTGQTLDARLFFAKAIYARAA